MSNSSKGALPPAGSGEVRVSSFSFDTGKGMCWIGEDRFRIDFEADIVLMPAKSTFRELSPPERVVGADLVRGAWGFRTRKKMLKVLGQEYFKKKKIEIYRILLTCPLPTENLNDSLDALGRSPLAQTRIAYPELLPIYPRGKGKGNTDAAACRLLQLSLERRATSVVIELTHGLERLLGDGLLSNESIAAKIHQLVVQELNHIANLQADYLRALTRLASIFDALSGVYSFASVLVESTEARAYDVEREFSALIVREGVIAARLLSKHYFSLEWEGTTFSEEFINIAGAQHWRLVPRTGEYSGGAVGMRLSLIGDSRDGRLSTARHQLSTFDSLDKPELYPILKDKEVRFRVSIVDAIRRTNEARADDDDELLAQLLEEALFWLSLVAAPSSALEKVDELKAWGGSSVESQSSTWGALADGLIGQLASHTIHPEGAFDLVNWLTLNMLIVERSCAPDSADDPAEIAQRLSLFLDRAHESSLMDAMPVEKHLRGVTPQADALILLLQNFAAWGFQTRHDDVADLANTTAAKFIDAHAHTGAHVQWSPSLFFQACPMPDAHPVAH